uniref:ApaG domain-containing protein n=2 Tax=Palpitomonas bilix TaxID=652834 RepID=A0A7S3DCQ9_9EUKA|mmetsp:Transcript_31923/g.83341  ORF Transcript_31923/g.83341 Transcript_31923/m.83341 type:complete len:260 (+) Transcript_31923:197-976(+)
MEASAVRSLYRLLFRSAKTLDKQMAARLKDGTKGGEVIIAKQVEKSVEEVVGQKLGGLPSSFAAATSRLMRSSSFRDIDFLLKGVRVAQQKVDYLTSISSSLSTRSKTVTKGVEVQAASSYVARSQPDGKGAYVFSYNITISNKSEKEVQLMTRKWRIEDGHGKVNTVEGPGVVGLFPHLQPGEEHRYSSFCPLLTPTGVMEGSFMFVERNTVNISEEGEEGGSELKTSQSDGGEVEDIAFEVHVAPFALRDETQMERE